MYNIARHLLIISLTGAGTLVGCSGENPAPVEEQLPPVEFTQTPEATTTDYFAKFTFVSEGAQSFQCRLGPDEFSDCTSPVFLPSVGAGEHVFEVRAVSSSGATGDATSYAWKVNNPIVVGHNDLITTPMAPAPVAPNSWRGIIRINCDFSHSSYNDPVVFPGIENKAHLHRFYGQMLVDHLTTTESLISTGSSSCQGDELNRSSYWVPALLAPKFDPQTGTRMLDKNGDPAWAVVPAVDGNDAEAHEIFYYSAAIDDLAAIQPIPVGLKMIAGNSKTMPGEKQDTSIVRWHCQSWGSDDSANPQFSATIPQCVAPDRLRMDIFFPSCWNGVDLDSSDHKSHMAYPVNDGGPGGTHCPDTHPIALVRPSYHYAFGVKPDVYDPVTKSSIGWRLASDMYEVTDVEAGGLSLHGDWVNGWHPAVMETMLEGCIRKQLDCHDGNLANGFRLSGTQPGTQNEPEIVNQGMGY